MRFFYFKHSNIRIRHPLRHFDYNSEHRLIFVQFSYTLFTLVLVQIIALRYNIERNQLRIYFYHTRPPPVLAGSHQLYITKRSVCISCRAPARAIKSAKSKMPDPCPKFLSQDNKNIKFSPPN